MKKNCWEYKRCQRQPGGRMAHDLGVCPAAIDIKHDGINHGQNGGRYCWKIAGTLCGGNVQGYWAKKIDDCMNCDFLNLVKKEEGNDFNLGVSRT